MKICIFGAGGVGGYFGGRLAQAGMDVTFVARGAQAAALQENGLKVSSISGNFHLGSVQVVTAPSENGPYDIALVAVKAWQIEAAAAALVGTLNEGGVAIPLLNGVEAPDALAKTLGAPAALAGLCGIFSFLDEPGHIRHAGTEPFIQIGERDGSQSQRVHTIATAMNEAQGMTVTVPEDMRAALWLKFLFIVAMSGVGSVTRAPIGITRDNPSTRNLLETCVRETYEVGIALGIPLPDDAVESTMNLLDGVPSQATASMQRDIMNGKPSELQSQNAAVVRLGESVAVETTVNSFICAALSPLELRASGEVAF